MLTICTHNSGEARDDAYQRPGSESYFVFTFVELKLGSLKYTSERAELSRKR